MIYELIFLKEIDERLGILIDRAVIEPIRWSGNLFEDLINCIIVIK
jgi:hypothetical protein